MCGMPTMRVLREVTTGSATDTGALLDNNWFFNRSLKFSRGSERRSAAMRTRGFIAASTRPRLPSARESITSTALFSCSIFLESTFFGSLLPGCRERLGIGTLQARSQAAEGAELQLLYRAF